MDGIVESLNDVGLKDRSMIWNTDLVEVRGPPLCARFTFLRRSSCMRARAAPSCQEHSSQAARDQSWMMVTLFRALCECLGCWKSCLLTDEDLVTGCRTPFTVFGGEVLHGLGTIAQSMIPLQDRSAARHMRATTQCWLASAVVAWHLGVSQDRPAVPCRGGWCMAAPSSLVLTEESGSALSCSLGADGTGTPDLTRMHSLGRRWSWRTC